MTPADAARHKYCCPACEHPLEEEGGVFYCPKCGKDMEDEMFKRELMAIKFCESRGIVPLTQAGIAAVDAFSAGYDTALAIGRENAIKNIAKTLDAGDKYGEDYDDGTPSVWLIRADDLEAVREQGRKERTVEIAKKFGGYVEHDEARQCLGDDLRETYHECFGEGEGNGGM